MALTKALITIDSFKQSFTSLAAGDIVAQAFTQAGITSTPVAIADGGEGTVAAFLHNKAGGKLVTQTVHDPYGNVIQAAFGWYPAEKLAVVETAAASGIQFVQPQAAYRLASSQGTGELIGAAIKLGAQKVIVGLGGSGTVDAGIGLLAALGVQFYTAAGQVLAQPLQQLTAIKRIDTSKAVTNGVTLLSASDVTSPLTGANGAVQLFGHQKGLAGAAAVKLEQEFQQLAQQLDPQQKGQVAGDGAAGGLGFGLRLLGSQVHSGFDLIAQVCQFEQLVQAADIVITGEGQIDSQSMQGKVPVKIAQIAQQQRKPCLAFVGNQVGDLAAFQPYGLTSIFPIVDHVCTLDQALAAGEVNLARTAQRVAAVLTQAI
ncbi:glycerate kinase family protein [Loigolactobacillus jiayinensis]|uniref:Glycerate kinase n=1 Tax=Loigolactobacillus jiayinensis TaxID=2486016 RepID=A0ABW1RF87_9LACO|nr:glycerate kinase [Loigolactobacillus jiayinensis]